VCDEDYSNFKINLDRETKSTAAWRVYLGHYTHHYCVVWLFTSISHGLDEISYVNVTFWHKLYFLLFKHDLFSEDLQRHTTINVSPLIHTSFFFFLLVYYYGFVIIFTIIIIIIIIIINSIIITSTMITVMMIVITMMIITNNIIVLIH